MPAIVVSVLAVALAGFALDAAPLPTTADSNAIHTEIVAGDPKLTTPPAPLERLVAAVELAEEKLRQATDMDDVDDFLILTAHGRKAAYGRTGEAVHMCRLIAAADLVLARERVTPGLSASATDFRQGALAALGETSCEDKPPHERSDSLPPTDDNAKPDRVAVGPSGPAELMVVPLSAKPADRRRLRVGLGTLIPGLVIFAPVAGLLAYRVDARRDMADLTATTATRPATDAELRQAAALHDRFTATTAAAVALGVTGGALVVTGAVLLAVKRRPTRAALAPWGGRGVAGLVLQGRF